MAHVPEHLARVAVPGDGPRAERNGVGNGLFAVLAAAWVMDRLDDPRRSGEAQVIVGSCLVLGSAIGPAVAGFLVGLLGYRGLFWALSRRRRRRHGDRRLSGPRDSGEVRTDDPCAPVPSRTEQE